MRQQLAEAIHIIRELPDDQQNTIARQLMRLIDLAQLRDLELASTVEHESVSAIWLRSLTPSVSRRNEMVSCSGAA
jgi:hypothetical protein